MPRADHAEAVAELALDLLEAVEAVSEGLQVRIGINSGPVVAGVIGTKKFAYDLWGDTVNTAARMESHGIPSSIHVTEATHQRLDDTFTFEERGTVEVKGKGAMRTYLLTGRKQRQPVAPAEQGDAEPVRLVEAVPFTAPVRS